MTLLRSLAPSLARRSHLTVPMIGRLSTRPSQTRNESLLRLSPQLRFRSAPQRTPRRLLSSCQSRPRAGPQPPPAKPSGPPAFFSHTPGVVRRVIIWGVIGVNTTIWLLWQASTITPTRGGRDADGKVSTRAESQQARSLALQRTLLNNWTLSQHNLREGRHWTLLTSAFSHRSLGHLAFNMIVFHMAATTYFSLGLGPARFLVLATGAAIFSGVGSIGDERRQGTGVERIHLGASGMVQGLLTAVTMIVPWMKVNLFFVPVGVPLWAATGGFLAYDMFEVSQQHGPEEQVPRTTIGHAAHLNGAAFGALYYLIRLRKTFGRAWGGILAWI